MSNLTLPPAQILAVSYASGDVRRALIAFLQLDWRLAQFVSQASEPILAQMRIAWWRDELAKPIKDRPRGDPILDAISDLWSGEEAALMSLVDGWEELLVEPPLPANAAENFAEGRAAGFVAIARIAGASGSEPAVSLAARRWAFADLAAKTSDLNEKAEIVATALALGADPVRLPRALRPLLVLDRFARTSLAAGGAPLMQGRRNILTAMRLGLFGR